MCGCAAHLCALCDCVLARHAACGCERSAECRSWIALCVCRVSCGEVVRVVSSLVCTAHSRRTMIVCVRDVCVCAHISLVRVEVVGGVARVGSDGTDGRKWSRDASVPRVRSRLVYVDCGGECCCGLVIIFVAWGNVIVKSIPTHCFLDKNSSVRVERGRCRPRQAPPG